MVDVTGAVWELELIPLGMHVRRAYTFGDPSATRVMVEIEPKDGKVSFRMTGSGATLANPQDMLPLLEQVIEEARAAYDGSEEIIEMEDGTDGE